MPDRVRRIAPGFAFVPNRFLHDGFFASLTPLEHSLYFFLVLAGDRNGVSFFSYERICAVLEITAEQYLLARNRLIDRDLIAFDGQRYQVLSLPQTPVLIDRRLTTFTGGGADGGVTVVSAAWWGSTRAAEA